MEVLEGSRSIAARRYNIVTIVLIRGVAAGSRWNWTSASSRTLTNNSRNGSVSCLTVLPYHSFSFLLITALEVGSPGVSLKMGKLTLRKGK